MQKNLIRNRFGSLLLVGLAAGPCAVHVVQAQGASEAAVPRTVADEVAGLKAENERLKSLVPSQSHAMMDVAYHFTNLWFAGEQQNWPLAQFYLNESRSHIRWAVRIAPVRRVAAGELKLEEIFTAFDNSLLAEIQKQIAAKNRKAFKVAYQSALGGCNGCHAASDKPFLHVKIPEQQEVRIIDFKPAKP
jgi:cytochrome c553